MTTKRVVKAAPAKVRRPSVPKCPSHPDMMMFDVEVMAWRCPRVDCKMVAYPEAETGMRRPVLGKGAIELVKQGDRVFLRAVENNVMVEVTKYVKAEMQTINHGPRVVTLEFNLVNDLTGK